jgi:hypothetical protein
MRAIGSCSDFADERHAAVEAYRRSLELFRAMATTSSPRGSSTGSQRRP